MCFNPRRKEDRRRNREQLFSATEKELKRIGAEVRRKGTRLQGKANIAKRVEQGIGKYKMRKHFRIHIEERELTWQRREDTVEAESRLDGIYVIRTSLDSSTLRCIAGGGILQEPLAGGTCVFEYEKRIGGSSDLRL